MKATTRTLVLGAIASTLLFAGSARAEKTPNFCGSAKGTDNCVKVLVENDANVTAISVKIAQKEDTAASCAKLEKKHKDNLVGAGLNDHGDYFTFFAKVGCSYRVTFKTTKGCGGDKVAKLTAKKIKKGQSRVVFSGNCGSLHATTL